MTMNVSRRDVLRFTAGGAVGAMMTPAPWKALDDVAIWTQNWSWIPKPPKGPVTMRATACALCPAGCPVQARCIGGLPVSMHAASGGGLCPLGLTGHHLPYHPARVVRPLRLFHDGPGSRRIPVQIDAAVAAAAGAIRGAKASSRTVAVIDTRPGRSVSWGWQRFLATVPRGAYVPAPAREGSRFPSGVDLDSIRTIVSFRAPLAEEWGPPQLRKRLLDRLVNLIQIEPTHSPTAAVAGRWLAAQPGSEAALAMAIASQLHEGTAGPGEGMTPEIASALTGIPAETIAATAREIAQTGPALVVAEEGLGRAVDAAIVELNTLLGHSVVAQTDLLAPFAGEPIAPATELEVIEDSSIALLLLDMSGGDAPFPWPLVRRKLAPKAIVIALSPFLAGTATHADYIVPTLPYLETLLEIPTPFDSTAARLTISAPLLPPRHAAVDPVKFLRAITRDLPGQWTKSEELMRARVSRIHERGEGNVGEKSVADFASADEMWEGLLAGTPWTGAAAAQTRVSVPHQATLSREQAGPAGSAGWPSLLPALSEKDRSLMTAVTGRPPRQKIASSEQRADGRGAIDGGVVAVNAPLTLVIRTPRDVTASAAVSPVMTKLYRESGLRRSPEVAVVNPATARQLGLAAGRRAKLLIEGGALPVVIATDHAVMPGVVEMTAGPDAIALGERGARGRPGILDVVTADASGSWRTVAARLVEA
jgi:menaquinone reductase, molybdopterin-binding-like subunit